MNDCSLIKHANRLAAAAERLDYIVRAAAVGQIPEEILAPLIPLLDARIPPIVDALVDFNPPPLDPWLPPWRTNPPDPTTNVFVATLLDETGPIYFGSDDVNFEGMADSLAEPAPAQKPTMTKVIDFE